MDPPDSEASPETHETAPCLACGRETPVPDEVHSPVCYRPLCPACRDSGESRTEGRTDGATQED
ncbi:hypothetical protein C497_16272 [Halalkalicoccus jeotgali B3]|uniref:Uncharacterized protein n=1 Tax=Halalkalicoccus jeotgali (strain DSM 18796 / CECT 7217 / JCM 14584 / KCTC 4019 / B3) TaxID=795797 RepID=D8J7A5_HALJB|nr:hypothetical protein HacjB3_03035 [Halalkalicoccus jeotgali B3]ELY33954.1 hypothetical protein C497_16272 [Halalkalicoccus jeotgali B3]